MANKANISEADFFYKSAEIEDKRLKIKRRMLGNIRFVGELFKQKLLSEATIQACIADLMGTPDAWKEMGGDEQVIECLCHLLTTVGDRLEAKTATNHEATRNFNACFDRLRYLSKDKSLNSRMRFAIQEVVSLRDNGWQKRRGTEAPQKIADLHKKMHTEHSGHGGIPIAGGRPLPGSLTGQQRLQQQQQQLLHQQMPTQQPRILARGAPGGRGGPAQDGRKGLIHGADVSRSLSTSVYEQSLHRGVIDVNQLTGRPLSGDPIRRTQSEYSSGAGTPTSVGSGPVVYQHQQQQQHFAHEPSRHMRHLSERSSIAEDGEIVEGEGEGEPEGEAEGQGEDADVDFSDKAMQNRAKSVVSEFIEQSDAQEVKLFLGEGPRGICGHFVLQIIDKCLNAKKGPVMPTLLALLENPEIREELLAGQEDVLQALRWCEEFKCLVDTTMDYKEVQ